MLNFININLPVIDMLFMFERAPLRGLTPDSVRIKQSEYVGLAFSVC